MTVTKSSARCRLYIAGAPGGGSIGPPVHNFIAQQLQKAWTMQFLESSTIHQVVDLFRSPEFAGGIVTMPWKKAIIPYLDEADELVSLTGACNMVCLAPDGRLQGTNVDWVGIKVPLLAARPKGAATHGMIYGAGGASRAALYVLAVELKLQTIYVVNRDDCEISDFLKDAAPYQSLVKVNIVHVKTAEQATTLAAPSYVVGTVPDMEARTYGEIEARAVLREFLSRRREDQGVLLDMCYHPRATRNLQLAKQYGWITIEGIRAVGHQFKVQWELWTGQEVPHAVESEAFSILETLALADKTVTPDM